MPLLPPRRASATSGRCPRRLLRLEALEDRIVPAFPKPQLVVFSPVSGASEQHNVTVSGQVSDLFLPLASLKAEVDSGPRFNVAYNSAGTFHFQTSLALDGSADGTHVIHLWVADLIGQTTSKTVSFTLDTSLVNQAVTTNPGVQQDPSIAVDPTNSKHEVIAYMDYSLLTTGYAGIGVAVTEDNGVTWTHTSIPLAVGFNQGAASPTVQFDASGQVFVSFMAATFEGIAPPITDLGATPINGSGTAQRALGFQSNNGIFVAGSDDGGMTWNQPVAVTSQLYDGTDPVSFVLYPELAIDTFGDLPNGQPNPYFGHLYVAWSLYYPPGQFPGEPTSTGGSEVMLAVSKDEGRSWQLESQPVAVNVNGVTNNGFRPEGNGAEAYTQVTIGPEGDIYIDTGTSSVAVYHSTDDGADFTQPNNVNFAGYPFQLVLQAVPSPTLTNDQFRTQSIHDIAADPTRPGYVYCVATEEIRNGNGTVVDPAVVIFARSTDYGVTWQSTFQVGTYADANVLNDDNFGQSPTGTSSDVADGQAMPHLVSDAQGDIGVIWYDTRRDPADKKLDVFGTISTDGGQVFSANFRITDQSFDPNAGVFTDATGQPDYYIGDFIGLAMANGTGYAAWTDTRSGKQDIEFTRFSFNPPPAPPSNRFAPDNTAALAADLSQVVTRSVPKLTITAGQKDWFRVQAASTGNLTVNATPSAPGDVVRLELFDASGATLLATGSPVRNTSGQVVAQTLTFPGKSGQTYKVLVLPGSKATATSPVVYTLNIQSLTANLGTQVNGVKTGSLAAKAEAYYALTAPAAGSLDVILTPAKNVRGNFQLAVLDPSDLSVLAAGQSSGTAQMANLTVTQGQPMYLRVTGDAGIQGAYTLQFTNLDQYATKDNNTLFFPTGGNPSEVVLADLTGNGKQDIVVDYADQNFVSVLLNNGDGTFQAPRDYPVGAFQAMNNSTLGGVPDYKREMVIADFNGDGIPDIAVLNYQSATVSLLMGLGGGAFAPQHLIPTIASPFALAAADLTNNDIMDLVVVDSTGGPVQQGEVFLGRGDGTFQSPIPFTIPSDPGYPSNTIQIADLTGNGKEDLVYEGFTTYVLLGNGDGTFGPATAIGPGNQGRVVTADLTGDGTQDIVASEPGITGGGIDYFLGNGDGTFEPFVALPAGQNPIAVAVADVGSQVTLLDGSTVLGPPDEHADIVVADNGETLATSSGPAEVVVLPGLVNSEGQFDGFGAPIPLAPAVSPLDLKIGDLNGKGVQDVVVAEANGVEVIRVTDSVTPSLRPLDDPPSDPTDLGTVVHVLEPTLTIVPGHEEDDYTLTVPTEAAKGAGNEVLDFSGFFQALAGAGITMQVLDASGNLLGSGERFRVSAPQGAKLTLRVFGVTDSHGNQGSGAYTLDIDVLPQVVSAQAQPLLPGATSAPGGATASLVVTLQGDRLDPTSAQDVSNYTVTFLGPGGNQVIPIEAVVYDPSTNVDVASGTTYPTAVKQTLTFLFDQPLPAGSYQITISPNVQTAAFNADESSELAPLKGFTGHPVVTLASGKVTEGSSQQFANLVQQAGALGDFAVWAQGTPFFQQLHDDLSALLDSDLTQNGDDPNLTQDLLNQIQSRFDPALGATGSRPANVLVLFTDPVSLDLEDPAGNSDNYNLGTGQDNNGINDSFVSVVGNIEVVVVAVPSNPPSPNALTPADSANFTLTVSDVPATARGGVVLLGQSGDTTMSLTGGLRSGTTTFTFGF